MARPDGRRAAAGRPRPPRYSGADRPRGGGMGAGAAGLAVAAALEELPFACGLGTVSLMESDVTAEPLLAVDGYLHVRRPEPDRAALERLRPDEATAAGLLERLRAAGEVLA